MKIAVIGRSELLYETARFLIQEGFEIPLVITSNAAPEYKRDDQDFEKLAHQTGAHYIKTSKINSSEVIDKIKLLGVIDIAVSINYSGIIADEIIDLFPMGILNAHGGDLPKYRGNACQAWAIINGEQAIGLCIHKMIGGELDSGDIVLKSYLPITINTRIGEAYDWMEKTIPKLMWEAICKLRTDPQDISKQSKDPKNALRTYPRNPADGKIDWAVDAESIIRLINASSEPFAGAFCYYKGNKLKIWRASVFNDRENYCAIPGQISEINQKSKSIIVITGKGKIRIEEVESSGKRTRPIHIIKSIRTRFY